MNATEGTDRPLRADAVRSRALLLSAARAVFAERGTEASVADVAQAAGLGKGTVFRHFASKDDLVAAIVDEMLDDLIVTTEKLLTANDPAAALREFMTAGIDLQVHNQAFCDVAAGASVRRHPLVRGKIERLESAVEALVDRARRAGVVRDDVTGQDLMLLMTGVYQTAAPMLPESPDLWRRYLALTLDGLQPQAARPLPTPAPRP
ncbi:TetR/AcrR family transcriptional regulator [Kribbella sp. ALI-6-A]|uniref:TetR/AcrR family transcriptional regulator n=1 Tax=Kribbella sp. ALI-6-A TaxID=1933817 RepID=UPI00192D16F3|nr:TetR/AcrR family transcriptional regulator [Kribbella sp. ALI-6-A]